MLEQLKNDRSFHFHELISDGKVIGHIALLQRSLEWLFPLIQDGSDEAASSSPNLTVHRAKIIFDSTVNSNAVLNNHFRLQISFQSCPGRENRPNLHGSNLLKPFGNPSKPSEPPSNTSSILVCMCCR